MNTIQGSFGVDLTPLKRDFAEAARVAQSGGAKVEQAIATSSAAASRKASVNWASVLAQSGGPSSALADRIRRNSAAGFRPAPSGKYPSPMEEAGASGRGGVPVGVGRALSVFAGVAAIAQYFIQANEEAGRLREKIIEITKATGAGAFRGIGEMEENLKQASSTLDEIRKQTLEETQGGERTPWMTLGHIVRKVRQFATGDSDENEAAQKERLRKQAVQDIDAMAGKQHDLNEAEREGFEGSERGAALLKAQVEHRERLGKLAAAESAAGVQDKSARDAENERVTLVDRQIMRRFDLAKMQEESERRILAFHDSMLTKDQQGIAASKERVSLLQKELALTHDPIKRAGIQNQIRGIENQEAFARYQEHLKPQAQKNAERQAQQAYERWVKEDARNQGLENTHRDMSGNLIGGTDPITGEYVNKPRISALDMPMKSAFTDDYSLKSGRVGDTWTDQNKAGGPSTSTLGKIGVLDRIESKIDGIGANR